MYKRVNYTDVDPVCGGMYSLGKPLESEKLGATIIHCDPEWNSIPHDHQDDRHEEIYVLIDGRATVVVGDERIQMEAGDVIRIPPDATRQIRNGSDKSLFVLISAPVTSEINDQSIEWLTDSFIG